VGKGQDGGDKTELPTPKRLRDARNKGDVARSKEVGAVVVSLAWLVLFALVAGHLSERFAAFAETTLAVATTGDFSASLISIGWQGIELVLISTALLLAPVILLGLAAEWLQIGPIFTTEKLKPSLDKMNPVEGLKRMFGKDGLVELLKSLVKVLVLVAVITLAVRAVMPELGGMLSAAMWTDSAAGGRAAAAENLAITSWITVRLLGWTVAAFLCVAVLDRIHSKHSFIKKMKMSRRDVKQEHKNDEGDPHVKSHRREMHQEWANNNAVGAAGGASALLVNPTHIAIALDYHAEDCPVPVVAAKGEGPLAALMRKAAAENGVPIIRNVAAARALWAEGETGGIVPEEMFDVVAEVILWATRAREGKAPMEQDLDARRPVPATAGAR
jgi:type III secretion protein U